MLGSLSEAKVGMYRENGFVRPIRVLSSGEAADIRGEIELIEEEHSNGSLPLSLDHYFRDNGQVVIPLFAQIARTKTVLDAIKSIVSSNLMVRFPRNVYQGAAIREGRYLTSGLDILGHEWV